MRLIQALVPTSRRSNVLETLENEDIDYVITDECSDREDAEIVHFPVPTQAVEHVLTALREAGLEEEFLVVSQIETARTSNIEALEERFLSGTEADDSISSAEIRTRALNLTPGRLTYYAMTVLSAVVATAGLLLDSPAIVVGSMVIAPQVSAALTGTVGLVLEDRPMFVDGVTSLLGGLFVAVLSAFALAWSVRYVGIVPSAVEITAISQIQNRISPGLLAVVVGLCAGAAGAFGLATALSVSLVGVMIAIALIPAAATVGIGLAWGYPTVALGAFVLVVVNTTAILLAGVAVFWYLGYRPADWSGGTLRGNLTAQRLKTGALLVGCLAIVLLAAGSLLYGHVGFENDINDGVRETLADDAYADLELVAIDTTFQDRGLFVESADVTVTVARPADTPYPDLADTLETRIEAQTDHSVTVTVAFVEHSDSSEGDSTP
ncbi:DUF389 domain-containing protein [Natronosalvus amylolyticus]|uniref:DUF389 domain-containing protein n=1 Tax=Natronosalvus amylolyticus TaxID=2961994 RepID=UPI0020C994C1|nr:DUF389 domain-containing protein [Natronosalvus amylolyticus]